MPTTVIREGGNQWPASHTAPNKFPGLGDSWRVQLKVSGSPARRAEPAHGEAMRGESGTGSPWSRAEAGVGGHMCPQGDRHHPSRVSRGRSCRGTCSCKRCGFSSLALGGLSLEEQVAGLHLPSQGTLRLEKFRGGEKGWWGDSRVCILVGDGTGW